MSNALLRRLLGLTLVVGLSITVACTDDVVPTSPVDPAPAASEDLLGGLAGLLQPVGILKPITGLLTCNVTQTHTATKTVGRAGGVVTVGPHSLIIPPRALSSDVRITATAPAGNRVSVEFAPHGQDFERPVALTLSYRDCGLVRGLLLRIVYVGDNDRVLEILPSLMNVLRREVIAKTDHFSKYMLAY